MEDLEFKIEDGGLWQSRFEDLIMSNQHLIHIFLFIVCRKSCYFEEIVKFGVFRLRKIHNFFQVCKGNCYSLGNFKGTLKVLFNNYTHIFKQKILEYSFLVHYDIVGIQMYSYLVKTMILNTLVFVFVRTRRIWVYPYLYLVAKNTTLCMIQVL